MKKEKLIKLAQLLKLYTDIQTAQGTLTIEGDLEVGKEAFVYSDDEVVPAPSGEYETSDSIIVVEAGIIKEIKVKEIENEPAEQITEQEEQIPETTEQPTEEPTEQPNDETAELQAKIDELQAKIDELTAENEELKNKIKEAEKPVDEPVEKLSKQDKDDKTLQQKLIDYVRK